MWPRKLVVVALSALALTGSHALNLRRCDEPTSSSAVEDPVTTTSAEPTPTAPICSNLVGNPSFEDGNNDWEFYTATVTANDPSVAVTAEDGDHYVLMKIFRWATWGYVSQTIASMEVGKSYKLKFHYGLGLVQQVNVPGCKLSVKLNWAIVGSEIPLAVQTPGEYHEVVRTLVPTVANPLVHIYLACNAASPADVDVLLDNISIVEDPCVEEPAPTETPTTPAEPVCTNRIANPSFENGADGWTVPYGTVQRTSGSMTPQDQSQYLYLTLPSGFTTTFSQTLSDVEVGQTYTLGLHYALGSFQVFVSGRCYFSVSLDGMQLGDTVSPTPGPVSQWELVERVFTVANSSPVLQITSSCYQGQAGFMMDGFSLVESACL